MRRAEGRIPTITDRPSDEARTRPPLVAVAAASTLLDHEAAPGARKNSCQKVLRGWSRLPMGTVAQVPADVWTDVASGVGSEGRLAEERTDGAPLVEQATKATAASPRAAEVGRLMQKLVGTGPLFQSSLTKHALDRAGEYRRERRARRRRCRPWVGVQDVAGVAGGVDHVRELAVADHRPRGQVNDLFAIGLPDVS